MVISAAISREQAGKLLTGGNHFWQKKKDLAGIEMVLLPLYVFSIDLTDKRGGRYTETLSVDAVRGEFALFREAPAEPEETVGPDFLLCPETARDIALAESRRILLKRNLKNANTTEISEIGPARKLAWPYWIGYYKKGDRYDFSVIDAVDGSVQGIKMKPVFIDLLLSAEGKRGNGVSGL
jgi:hypothetical protein